MCLHLFFPGKVADLEAAQGDMREILPLVAGTETKRMIEGGDIHAGVLACSQSIGIVREVRPVADVIAAMVREAEEIRQRLAA